MGDSYRDKEEMKEIQSDLRAFFRTYNGEFKNLFKNNISAWLPLLYALSQEEREKIELSVLTPTDRANELLDLLMNMNRGDLELQRQFLELVCKDDADFQERFIKNHKKIFDYVVGRFQYSQRTTVRKFPPDSRAFKLLAEEFKVSADNPFLPSLKEFASKCGVKGKEFKLDNEEADIRDILNSWQGQVGGEANVENLVKIVSQLELKALREELLDSGCFGLYLPEEAPAREVDDFRWKGWKPGESLNTVLFKISRELNRDQCLLMSHTLKPKVPDTAQAAFEGKPAFMFTPSEAYDLLKAWYQAHPTKDAHIRLRDALQEIKRADLIDKYKEA